VPAVGATETIYVPDDEELAAQEELRKRARTEDVPSSEPVLQPRPKLAPAQPKTATASSSASPSAATMTQAEKEEWAKRQMEQYPDVASVVQGKIGWQVVFEQIHSAGITEL